MNKKTDQQVADDQGFDSLFTKAKPKEPIYTAIFELTDEGSCGKSTAAIAQTSILRRLNKDVDLWLCDPDHTATMERFGKRNATGELEDFDSQLPRGCGFFNIRKSGSELIDKLTSTSKYKIFDMPASSIDELPELFDSIPKFLEAFEKTRTKFVICIPFITKDKSIASVHKLKRMFLGVNPNVTIEFCFIFNHSIKNNKIEVMNAYNADSEIRHIKDNHKVVEGHIDAKASARFIKVIDGCSEKGMDWFDLMNSDEIQLFDQIILEQFLQEHAKIVKQIM